MHLRALALEGFRNLLPQRLNLEPGVTLVVGANGAGKTNLLEAVAVVGNLVSFRRVRTAVLVQRGSRRLRLLAEVERDGGRLTLLQEVDLDRQPLRRLYRDEHRISSSEYIGAAPVMTFSTHDRDLLAGPPERRRRFLDRLAFLQHPESLVRLQRYRRIVRQRNALLATGAADRNLEPFDHAVATCGAAVIHSRLEALRSIEQLLGEELEALGWSLPIPNLRYHSHDRSAPADQATAAQRLRSALLRTRQRERSRGHTIVGPHRHDLEVSLSGAPARELLSAGQGRLLVTALRLAGGRVVEEQRGLQPVAVFDDVDAELDAEGVRRLMARLSDGRQVLLATPHRERLQAYRASAQWWSLDAGRVVDETSGGSAVD